MYRYERSRRVTTRREQRPGHPVMNNFNNMFQWDKPQRSIGSRNRTEFIITGLFVILFIFLAVALIVMLVRETSQANERHLRDKINEDKRVASDINKPEVPPKSNSPVRIVANKLKELELNIEDDLDSKPKVYDYTDIDNIPNKTYSNQVK